MEKGHERNNLRKIVWYSCLKITLLNTAEQSKISRYSWVGLKWRKCNSEPEKLS